MNIKEKFNNIFKYPATYIFALTGYETLFFLIKLYGWLSNPENTTNGASFVTIFYTFQQVCLFLILIGATVVIHTICEILDWKIKSESILNNTPFKIITSIGIFSTITFAILVLIYFLLIIFI